MHCWTSQQWHPIVLVFSFVLASTAAAEDWPRWRGPRGDGTWHAPPLPERWTAEQLPIQWRQPIGGGYAGVVAVDDRVWVFDRQPAEEKEQANAAESSFKTGDEPTSGATASSSSSAVSNLALLGKPAVAPKPGFGTASAAVDAAPNSDRERILCFNATDGRPLWTHEYPVRYGQLDYGNGPRAAPTIHDGRLYAMGALGHAVCLDAASGSVIWSRDFFAAERTPDEPLAREVLPEWGLAASPVIAGNLVIFHPGCKPGGCFVALDRNSGKEKWRAGDDPAGYATPIVIQRGGRRELVAWTPEQVLGLAVDTGKILWSVPYKVTYGVSIATPIYVDGIALVSGYWEGTKAIKLGDAPDDAKLLWEENRYLRGLMSQPLARDGLVYSLDKTNGLSCFELTTGRVLWNDGNRMTPRGRNPQATMIWTGDGDRVLVLNSDGELILARFTREGYVEQSRAKLIGPTWAHPAYASSRVFARDDQELVCAELPAARSR
ncbi:MAG: PQQ-like beta-propeller repeat protein [Pirellulales bacterium]|nr:PQQ-like beta-propeller repeat protein [Pirellulales bacterium]